MTTRILVVDDEPDLEAVLRKVEMSVLMALSLD